jgi:hypothetical protein
MNSKEFFAWLTTCPTHKYEVTVFEGDYCRVIFPVDDEEDEE